MPAKLWEKPPHTEMKHAILRRYLQAWLPILSKWHGRVAIIDGFAGPGEYTRKDPKKIEPGSPLIIIDTILNHNLRKRFPEIVLLFIEKEPEYATHLEDLLKYLYKASDLAGIRYQVVKGGFASTLQPVLDTLKEEGLRMAPCFAFVDPFGPRGLPIQIIAQIMEHQYSEVLINFPYDPINRHLTVPEYEESLDELYGCTDWRNVRSVRDSQERNRLLHELYIKQLKDVAGAKYVVSFLMRDIKNRAIYFLVFGTRSVHGLNEMKQSMWRVAPTGSFEFSDYTYNPNQLELFSATPDFEELASIIWNTFKGQSIRIDDLEEWVTVNTARYAKTHVRSALQLIEEKGKLTKYYGRYVPGQGWVKDTPYPKRRFYPTNTVIEFYT